MRFFTPELYVRFNSSDEDQANAADAAWEAALQGYQKHLDGIRERLPSQVRKLSALNLHDAEVLAFEEVAEPAFTLPSEGGAPVSVWSAMAILSVRQNGQVVSLIYLLWDRVRDTPPSADWPFSGRRPHWLYDEIDMAPDRPGAFVHRILLSDGRAIEIPFTSVVSHDVPLVSVVENGVAKQRA